jgi:hypothetical protein
VRHGRTANSTRERLDKIAERIEAIESRTGSGDRHGRSAVVTGWGEDTGGPNSPIYGESRREEVSPGRLRRGVLHEWFGLVEPEISAPSRGRGRWSPPLCLLSHLALQALITPDPEEEEDGTAAERDRGWVVWVGRRIWPYPRVLLRTPISNRSSCGFRGISASPADRRLLGRSLLIDPPDEAARLWAVDLALRSPAVTAIVADGSALAMAETRRMQLAAETGGTLALLARPPDELRALSAAATRWCVRSLPSDADRPRWSVELVRRKGAGGWRQVRSDPGVRGADDRAANVAAHAPGERTRRANQAGKLRWILEWDHAQGVVASPADVVDRSGASSPTVSPPRHGDIPAADRRGRRIA